MDKCVRIAPKSAHVRHQALVLQIAIPTSVLAHYACHDDLSLSSYPVKYGWQSKIESAFSPALFNQVGWLRLVCNIMGLAFI